MDASSPGFRVGESRSIVRPVGQGGSNRHVAGLHSSPTPSVPTGSTRLAEMWEGRLDTFALLGVGALLGAVAIAIAVPPANRYELSIYDAYPSVFWVLIVVAIFAGALVIVRSAGITGDRSWAYGLVIMLVTNALLLLLPYIRGYRMFGRADPMSHLGFIQNIINTGGVTSNIYAPTHVLALAVVDATGFELTTVSMLIPIVFSMVYFGSIFYALKSLFDSRKKFLYGLPFVMLPVLRHAHLGFRPFDLSVMLIPLLLYLLIKSQQYVKPSIRLPFVVILVATLLYHPLTALFSIGVILLFYIGKYIPQVTDLFSSPTNVLALTVAVFLAWYSNYAGVILRFESVLETFFGLSEGDPPLETYTQTVEEASVAWIDIMRVLTFNYGIEFLTLGIGFAFFAFIVFHLPKQRYDFDAFTVTLAGIVVIYGFGGFLFLVSDLIVPPERPFQIAKIGGILLSGLLFYFGLEDISWSYFRPKFRTFIKISFIMILLVLAFLVTFSLYKSPLTSDSNHQMTEMEIDGTMWLTMHANSSNGFTEFGFRYYRTYHSLYGTNGNPFGGASKRPPPPHFNYTTNTFLGQSYSETVYMTITRKGRIVYPGAFENYPEYWRYTPSEFARLERDNTVRRIYDNGDFTQYMINGQSKTLE